MREKYSLEITCFAILELITRTVLRLNRSTEIYITQTWCITQKFCTANMRFIFSCAAISLISLLIGAVVKIFPIWKVFGEKNISKLYAACFKEIQYFDSSIKLIARNYFARRVFRIGILSLLLREPERGEARRRGVVDGAGRALAFA